MNVQSVIEFLRDRGSYKPTNPPIHVMEVNFEFDGVLVGPGGRNGLVLIHELKKELLGPISRKIRAFAIALERTDSMRPVTLILVGASLKSAALAELAKLCRVITVSEHDKLNDALAAVMPLELPPSVSTTESADAALKGELKIDLSDAFVSKLLKAARQSESEVQKSLRSIIEGLAQPKKKS